MITGCSSGFGRAIARAALAHGDRVIATSRDVEKIEDLKSHGAVSLALDVRQADETVRERVGAAVREYGRIDVLVNCAGYILTGAVEECR